MSPGKHYHMTFQSPERTGRHIADREGNILLCHGDLEPAPRFDEAIAEEDVNVNRDTRKIPQLATNSDLHTKSTKTKEQRHHNHEDICASLDASSRMAPSSQACRYFCGRKETRRSEVSPCDATSLKFSRRHLVHLSRPECDVLLALTRHMRKRGRNESILKDSVNEDAPGFSESVQSLFESEATAESSPTSFDFQEGRSAALSDDNKIAMIRLARKISAADSKQNKLVKHRVAVAEATNSQNCDGNGHVNNSAKRNTRNEARASRQQVFQALKEGSGDTHPVRQICCLPSGFSTDDMLEKDKIALGSFYFGNKLDGVQEEETKSETGKSSESDNEFASDKSVSEVVELARMFKGSSKHFTDIAQPAPTGRRQTRNLGSSKYFNIGARAPAQHTPGSWGSTGQGLSGKGNRNNRKMLFPSGLKAEKSLANKARSIPLLKTKRRKAVSGDAKQKSKSSGIYLKVHSEYESSTLQSSETDTEQHDGEATKKPPVRNNCEDTLAKRWKEAGKESDAIAGYANKIPVLPGPQGYIFDSSGDNQESFLSSTQKTESGSDLTVVTVKFEDINSGQMITADSGDDPKFESCDWKKVSSSNRKKRKTTQFKHDSSKIRGLRGSSLDSLRDTRKSRENEETNDKRQDPAGIKQTEGRGESLEGLNALGRGQRSMSVRGGSTWTSPRKAESLPQPRARTTGEASRPPQRGGEGGGYCGLNRSTHPLVDKSEKNSAWRADATTEEGATSCRGYACSTFRLRSPDAKIEDTRRQESLRRSGAGFRSRLVPPSDRQATKTRDLGSPLNKPTEALYEGYTPRLSFNDQLDNRHFGRRLGSRWLSSNRLMSKLDIPQKLGDEDNLGRERLFLNEYRGFNSRQFPTVPRSRPFLFSKYREGHLGVMSRLNNTKTLDSTSAGTDFFRRWRGSTLSGAARGIQVAEREPLSPERFMFETGASSLDAMVGAGRFRRSPLRSEFSPYKRGASETLRCLNNTMDEWPSVGQFRGTPNIIIDRKIEHKVSLGTQSSLTEMVSADRGACPSHIDELPKNNGLIAMQVSSYTQFMKSVWPDMRRPIATFVAFFAVCWFVMLLRVTQ